jgi:hypothetical protein
MPTIPAGEPKQSRSSRGHSAVVIVLLGTGLLLRLRLAWGTFLNPDEALHYFLAHQSSLSSAYQASLTTAHPPLMILFLHCWSVLGTSEFFLRLPFVIAGVLFCWVMFLWIRAVAGACAAWFGVALFLFSPPLISLSAEIRQYAFLLLFCSCSLYFLERALRENSIGQMVLSAVSLWLAILTHYSALVFAVSLGLYTLVNIFRRKAPAAVGVWIAGQAIALTICAFLYKSQISKLQQIGIPSEIASTWLRSSMFHRGEDNLLIFIWSKTLRLFRYFFSNGTVGFLALLLFVFALVTLLRPSANHHRRALASLLLLPFLITLATSIAGVYPYGGTRHDVLLAMFAIPGIAIGLDNLPLGSKALAKWLKPAVLASALIIGNTFPSPTGPYIRPRNQSRELMQQAMSSLRALPNNSTIFTDDQGSMVLNYYLCSESMALPFASQRDSLLPLHCDDHDVLVATGTQAGFDRREFPALLNRTREAVKQGNIYLFQAGWIDDKEEAWLSELRQLGGPPQNFGPNILICRLDMPRIRSDGPTRPLRQHPYQLLFPIQQIIGNELQRTF